jgi:hypothetical protein
MGASQMRRKKNGKARKNNINKPTEELILFGIACLHVWIEGDDEEENLGSWKRTGCVQRGQECRRTSRK